DLKNFFGSADHEKIMTLLRQRIAAGKVLDLIESLLEAGCMVGNSPILRIGEFPRVVAYHP
ncbi:MAG: hypothetical protein MI674_01080, partial [Cytophagales bacterium]|nr:hypothetical protein [Cytophagales bacterium]